MNFQPRLEDVIEVFSFLENKYAYKIISSVEPDFMGCLYIYYQNDDPGLPDVKIEMERYILNFNLKIKDEFVPLPFIKKFLQPNMIIREWTAYRKKRIYKNYLASDYQKYFELYMENKNTFSLSKYHDFYSRYPFWVWKWYDK